MALKTPQNSVPEFAEHGEKGEAKWLNLQLKLVADVGIIGVPNAGMYVYVCMCVSMFVCICR